MDFHLTPEQRAFKDQAVKFPQKELTPLAEEANWKDGDDVGDHFRASGGRGGFE